MTHTPKPSIKDVPFSELTTLHELKRVSADDVREAVSAPVSYTHLRAHET